MKATDLYDRLEQDFVTPEITEDWYDGEMAANGAYICDNFKRRSLGLLCDFAEEINRVYTAVFPSDDVLAKILEDGAADAMLFLHHPLVWDLNRDPGVAFYQINPGMLEKLKERRIALFNLHLPLDNYSEYSTTKTLADALGVEILRPYNNYHGAVCGIIGTTDCKTVEELHKRYSVAVGHETRLYPYGDAAIENGIVSIVAGGGNDNDVVSRLVGEGVNVHVTGISAENEYSVAAHNLEREHKINLLGGGHYSSEKFACMAMCGYFQKLGLAAEFLPGAPCFEDM